MRCNFYCTRLASGHNAALVQRPIVCVYMYMHAPLSIYALLLHQAGQYTLVQRPIVV